MQANIFQDEASDSAKRYIEVADTIDDVPFAYIIDPDVAEKESLKAGDISVFKQVLVYH